MLLSPFQNEGSTSNFDCPRALMICPPVNVFLLLNVFFELTKSLQKINKLLKQDLCSFDPLVIFLHLIVFNCLTYSCSFGLLM